MKTKAMLLFLLLPVLLLSYNWEQVGPADVRVLSHTLMGGGICHVVYCIEGGVVVDGELYSYYGLTCHEAAMTMEGGDEMLVAMGIGTDSDGIYGLDLDSGEFTLYLWLLNPRFIKWCPADTSYYAGGEDGLYRSHDGMVWESIECFNMVYCQDMAIHDCNYNVGTETGNWYSHDGGETWTENTIVRPFSDLEYIWDGWCYAVFPGESYSSGLYKSVNFGESWSVEFWSTGMSCVSLEMGYPFIGWQNVMGTQQGLASWDDETEELTFYNEGLGSLMINSLSTDPMINTPNVICCTNHGAWMLTNFTSESSENELPVVGKKSYNYPNPFNPKTTIFWNSEEKSRYKIRIFNCKGELIHQENLGEKPAGECRYQWKSDGTSGLYLYELTGKSFISRGKLLLLK